jgi:hypothetical protein
MDSPLDATRLSARAHRTLRTHLPRRDWRWLGLRLRCGHCGQRYPCPPRRAALRHFAAGQLKQGRT